MGENYRLQIDGKIKRTAYIDSLNKASYISERLQKQFLKVYSDSVLKVHSLLKQDDGTSCGAYTVENLLLAAQEQLMPPKVSIEEIRRLHLEQLKYYNPKFYNGFYVRQRDNRPTTASLHEQLGYLKKLKNVWFSKQELSRILTINRYLGQISEKKIKTALWESFQFKDSYADNHKLHLNSIRVALKEAVVFFNHQGTRKDKNLFKEIIKLLLNLEWQIGGFLDIDNFCF